MASRLGLVAMSVLACACQGEHSSARAAAASSGSPLAAPAVSSGAPVPAEALDPLVGKELLPLADAAPSAAARTGHPVWLAVPLGATTPRPVVILQTSLPDVEGLCRGIQLLASRTPFVLCQTTAHGPPGVEGREPPGSDEPAAALRKALRQSKLRFPKHVASGSAVFVSVGESSRSATRLVREEPEFFARVLFVSAEFEGWSATAASSFARAGGKRALFGAARAEDVGALEHRAVLVRRSGGEARVLRYEGRWSIEDVLGFLREAWPWLVAGDPRFVAPARGPG